jgi:uncharacterized protein
MIRLIVLAIIGYFAYRMAKRWIQTQIRSRRVTGEEVGRIDDVMVKDPQCGTYFPRRDGISLQEGGNELLFCSRECRDKYVALHSKAGE